MRIETSILSNLIYNEEYTRKVVPHLKREYFNDRVEMTIFNVISSFFSKYNKSPTKEIILIELGNYKGITDEELAECEKYTSLLDNESTNIDWLVTSTETFCREKAVINAVMKSISIIDGSETKIPQDAIPSILSEALAITFDNSVGHNYIEDAEARYDLYHLKEDKIPFDLDIFNKITNNGLANKTLTIVMAPPGVGKSIFLCHCAANVLKQSKNVLYITLEMAEEKIAERIDANLLDITLKDLKTINKQQYLSRIQKLAQKTHGQLIVKEYPTSSAHVGHFRALLEELKLKQNFKPDMICIDYINICASQRMRGSDNSYAIVKAIAEEIRGLGVEYDVPMLSATQVNRDGMNNTDVDMTNTSESIGLPQTADIMFALISTEDLDKLGQVMVKQIKNRYNDVNYYKRFVVGLDKSKMRFYDLEDMAQDDVVMTGKVDEPENIEDMYAGFKF